MFDVNNELSSAESGTRQEINQQVLELFVENSTNAKPPASKDTLDESIADHLTAHVDGSMNEKLISAVLDDICLSIIASSAEDPCGQDVLTALDDVCSVEYNPGTVYPVLHELDAAGVLEQYQNRQQKQYRLADRKAINDRLEQTQTMLLSLYYLLGQGRQATKSATHR